jgi:16S rRNA processing protein RimM
VLKAYGRLVRAWHGHAQGNEIWLVKLAGVDSPEDADALRGHALLVRADERPPLEDADEFYVQV